MIDALLALPIAFFMAKVACPRSRQAAGGRRLTPLWASYLVKAYAWRSCSAEGGVLDDDRSGSTPGFGLPAVVLI